MGTIAQKGEYLEETKGLIAESINNLGGSITSETTFREYAEELDTIYSSLPKVTGENTEVTLTPTLKGKLGIVEKGNSTQESTTGKNLLKNIATTQTISGVTFTINEDKSVTINGTATANVSLYLNGTVSFTESIPAGTYKLSGCTNGSSSTYQLGLQLASADSVSGQIYFNCRTAPITITINNNNTYRSYITVLNGQTVNNVTIYPMLESGSTATSYEQYTGGIPAPNPSYPFPIKSVTGDNNVVVNSKNLMDTTTYTVSQGNLTVTRQNDGTFKLNGTSTSNTFIDFQNTINMSGDYTITLEKTSSTNIYFNVYTDNAYTTANRIAVVGSAGYKNFTYTGQCLSQRINIEAGTYNNDTVKIMLVKGTISSLIDYVEYQNQTLPLNLGNIELNKIGNYQDYIYKNNDKWYKKEEVGKVDLSTLSWNSYGTSIEGYTRYTTTNITNIKYVSSNTQLGDALCEKFIIHTGSGMSGTGAENCFAVDVSMFQVTTTTTPSGICKYALNTPTDIQITDTNLINQLEEIDKLKGYNGTTIITSTFEEGNAQMILSASGLKGE